MKRIGVFFMVIGLLASCTEDKGYSVNGTLDDTSLDGKKVYVSHLVENNATKKVDSTIIENGKFSVKLQDVDRQYLGFLTIEGLRTNLPYITENEAISFTIFKDSIRASKISGGEKNNVFSKYINHLLETGKRLSENQQAGTAAMQNNNPEDLEVIKKEREEILDNDKLFKINLAKEHSESLVAVMALTDLTNVKTVPVSEISTLFNGLSDDVKTSNLGKNLSQMLSARSATDIGAKAPEFSAPQPNGEMLALNDALGKVTILDFWASWCKPCRMENPNVVKVYNKYHDKGLNIVGISLDKSSQRERWLKAIEDDKLAWQHVSNLEFWGDPIAKQYNVRAIPATFILDENGNIIAKNLRGKALEDKMAELLN